MPQSGQKVVTVPQGIYDKVQKLVERGEEKSIAGTFIKATEIYLKKTDPITEDIKWLRENIDEIREMYWSLKRRNK
jgi:hypothetical protein